MNDIRRKRLAWGAALAFGFLAASSVHWCRGERLVLSDGRSLEGAATAIGGMAENAIANLAKGGEPNVARPIMMVDDGLRRSFVPKSKVAQVAAGMEESILEKIRVPQRVASSGNRIGHVGVFLEKTPWDKFGRCRITMATGGGPRHVYVGMTEITPRYIKVETLSRERDNLLWEMRIATSSVDYAVLREIIATCLDLTKFDHRARLVKLLLQSERYQDAQKELAALAADFPEDKRLQTEARAARQVYAKRILEEIGDRRKAAQHRLAHQLLTQFPREEVAGETLAQVKEMLEEYAKMDARGQRVLKQLDADLAAVEDSQLRARIGPAVEEIRRELSINTMDRMGAYERFLDDEKIKAEARLSLALRGWLLGSEAADTNLPVSLSLFEVRKLVLAYLTQPAEARRGQILKELASQEGFAPRLVAQLIARLRPPLAPPAEELASKGPLKFSIPGVDNEPDVDYFVQLPPEYDSALSYPAIVTLHAAGTTSQQQIDWWGAQAARHGYLVIAVDWAKEAQKEFGYTAREHAAVLGSLRDACRRLAIDTDRVFLSGHAMGGDAAWDIGGAHPDLWAGVIPIVATADRYCVRYWANAKNLSLYFVGGELDGERTVKNAPVLDRYLKGRFDTTVVEFLGRGHESFSDEIQRLFDWMGKKQRDFFPKQFATVSMRNTDNYFWWVELGALPDNCVVEPEDWPRRGAKAANLKADIKGNLVNVDSPAARTSVWLSPELVDFEQPVTIRVNGKKLNRERFVGPDLKTLLEDVRTRGERKHPFWVAVE